MIIITTFLIGMLLFQLLVTWEASRRLLKQVNQDLSITWFTIPKEEQPWMRRTSGRLTLTPKARKKARREMFS